MDHREATGLNRCSNSKYVDPHWCSANRRAKATQPAGARYKPHTNHALLCGTQLSPLPPKISKLRLGWLARTLFHCLRGPKYVLDCLSQCILSCIIGHSNTRQRRQLRVTSRDARRHFIRHRRIFGRFQFPARLDRLHSHPSIGCKHCPRRTGCGKIRPVSVLRASFWLISVGNWSLFAVRCVSGDLCCGRDYALTFAACRSERTGEN